MKYFQVSCLVVDILEKYPVCTTTKRAAKQFVEQHWRENLALDRKVVGVEEISQSQWNKMVYGE